MTLSVRFAALLLALPVLLISSPVQAGSDDKLLENPVGTAIALSVEPAAAGHCRNRDMQEAVACAIAACEADGGLNCTPMTWCSYAGTAGIMFGYNMELGLSQLYTACGGFTREGLEAMLMARCATDAGASDCSLVRFWGADGVEVKLPE